MKKIILASTAITGLLAANLAFPLSLMEQGKERMASAITVKKCEAPYTACTATHVSPVQPKGLFHPIQNETITCNFGKHPTELTKGDKVTCWRDGHSKAKGDKFVVGEIMLPNGDSFRLRLEKADPKKLKAWS